MFASKLISDGKDSGSASLGADTCKRAAHDFNDIKKDVEISLRKQFYLADVRGIQFLLGLL